MEVKKEQLLSRDELFVVNQIKSIEKYLYSNNEYVILVGIIDKLISRFSDLYGENLILKKSIEMLHDHVSNLGDELYQHGVECFSILDDTDQLRNCNTDYIDEIEEPMELNKDAVHFSIDSRGFPGDD